MAYSDSGMFGIYAATSDDKVNELVDVACGEIHKLTNDLKQEELDRAKTQVKTGMMMSRESTVNRAEKLAGNLAVFGRYITPEETIEEIEQITIDDLQTFAHGLLQQKDSVTVASLGKIDKLYKYEDIKDKL
jgi:predicted Zn-dependent peptidase